MNLLGDATLSLVPKVLPPTPKKKDPKTALALVPPQSSRRVDLLARSLLAPVPGQEP